MEPKIAIDMHIKPIDVCPGVEWNGSKVLSRVSFTPCEVKSAYR